MEQYIQKAALVAEIERRIKVSQDYAKCNLTESTRIGNQAQLLELNDILSFLDTLEVKDANEALRTEYEKGRADVISDTLSWLANVWPQYCSNPNIIDSYKEGVVKD